MTVRLAVVGSVDFANDTVWPEATRLIRAGIENLRPEVVISGGADGIDTLACDVASSLGMTKANGRFIEHLPKVRKWEAPGGYRDRNLIIAGDCTHMLCIRDGESKTYGSGWTADRAEEFGADVRRYVYTDARFIAPTPRRLTKA